MDECLGHGDIHAAGRLPATTPLEPRKLNFRREWMVGIQRYCSPLERGWGSSLSTTCRGLTWTIVGLDLFSEERRRSASEAALQSGDPAATSRIRAVQETNSSWSVLLLHPGAERPSADLASIVVRTDDWLWDATNASLADAEAHLYDGENDEFLSAIRFTRQAGKIPVTRYILNETKMESHNGKRKVRAPVQFADRSWTIVVVSVDETFAPDTQFDTEIFAFLLILLVIVAVWRITPAQDGGVNLPKWRPWLRPSRTPSF